MPELLTTGIKRGEAVALGAGKVPLAALKGACLCQAMEKQTGQRCLNLDISRSVSEEIKPVSLKELRPSITRPGRRRAKIRSRLPPEIGRAS